MIDLKVFDRINEALEELEIDEIKRQLEPLIKGMKIESPIFNSGAYLYRARKFTANFNKEMGVKYADLIYPPKHLSKLGRVNRQGQSVLYCSVSKEPVFFELQDLKPGDDLVLTFLQTTARMFVNNIGYTQYVFNKLGAKRNCPQWRPVGARLDDSKAIITLPGISPQELQATLSHDENAALRRALSECFMCSVEPSKSHWYKLTTAIGELHLGKIMNEGRQFAGIIYPSSRMWANGDNLALLPWFVDQHIKFKKAVHIRIDNQEGAKFSISAVDSSNAFGKDGKLLWLGRIPNWTLEPGRAARIKFTPGPDSDGDYVMSQEGTPCHWIAVDAVTGQTIEAR
jgi:hypothetical protein